MRFSTILSEAWRNVLSGTSRFAFQATLLTFLLGALTVVDALSIVSIANQVNGFRKDGASTFILESPGNISGTACERLAGMATVNSAGALRSSGTVTVESQPSAPVPYFESTPQLRKVLRSKSVAEAGVLIPSSTAERFGVKPGDPLSTDLGQNKVSDVFPYSGEGRNPTFSYAIIGDVPAGSGLFDYCWAEIWPYTSQAEEQLFFAIASSDTRSEVSFAQLNPTFGASIHPEALFNNRLTLYGLAAVPFTTLLFGIASVRRRRLEIAGALHVGVSRGSMTLSLLLETAVVGLVAGFLASSALTIVATTQSAILPSDLLHIEIPTIAAGVLCMLFGAGLGSFSVQENALLKYFKERA